MSTARVRRDNVQAIRALVPLLPLALQAILLFCFAIGHFIFLTGELTDLLESFLFPPKKLMVDLSAFKILYIGSILIVLQYGVYRFQSSTLLKFTCFLGGIFFCNILKNDILASLAGKSSSGFYTDSSLALVSFFFIVALSSIFRRLPPHRQQQIKYFQLTAAVMLLYSVLVLALSIPRIIFMIIGHF